MNDKFYKSTMTRAGNLLSAFRVLHSPKADHYLRLRVYLIRRAIRNGKFYAVAGAVHSAE